MIRRFGLLAAVVLVAVGCNGGVASDSPSASSSSTVGATVMTATTPASATTTVELMPVEAFDEPLYTWWWNQEGDNAPFSVSGAAVAAGLCSGGLLISGDGQEGKPPEEWDWFGNELECFDGSGTWSQRAEWRQGDSSFSGSIGIWEMVGLSGRYQGLRGVGIFECDLDPGYPHCEVWGEIRPTGPGEAPGETGVFYARNREWFVTSVGRPGVGLILDAGVLGDQPLEDIGERFRFVSGRLVWTETVIVPLCNIEVRELKETENMIWIGESFREGGPCPEWADEDALRNAFQEYGLPTQACLLFTFDDVEHERCGEFSIAANAQPAPAATTPPQSSTTSTTLPLVGFPPREIGSFSFTASEWGYRPDQGDVYMMVEVRPLAGVEVEDLNTALRSVAGRLVWEEATVDVYCRIERRESGEDWILIGDVFSDGEECDGWTDPDAMRNAFEKYGLPKEGCISFTFEEVEHDFCEPLT